MKTIFLNKRGFSLLFVSAIILVMGAIMVTVIGFHDINNLQKKTIVTQNKFKVIDVAITEYLLENGKLPCPAPLDCNTEGCELPFQEKKLGEEFREEGKIINDCDYDNSGVFSSQNENKEKILYGNVPATTLGLDNSFMVDSWGNKISYIVPFLLTQNEALKNIIVNPDVDLNISSGEHVKDTAIFLLLSNSTNISGAYAYDNKKSNSFSANTEEGKINTPMEFFEVDIQDDRYLKFFRKMDNLPEVLTKKSSGVGNRYSPNLDVLERDCDSTTYTMVVRKESKGNIIDEGEVIGKKGESKYFGFAGKVQEIKIPKNVTLIHIDLMGAQGGGKGSEPKAYKNLHGQDLYYYLAKGGLGGYTYATLNTKDDNMEKVGFKDRTIYVYVGEAGSNWSDTAQRNDAWNGGGATSGGSGIYEGNGGGATDIRTANVEWQKNLDTRLLIAGGGGGASANIKIPRDEVGGHGGGGNNAGGGGGGITFPSYRGKGGCSMDNRSNCSDRSIASNYINGTSTDKKYNGGGGGLFSGGHGGSMAGQGGGSGYIRGKNKGESEIFETSGGSNGVRSGNGYAIITYLEVEGVEKEDIIIEDIWKFYFPSAKVGETRKSNEECPKKVGGVMTETDKENPQELDYYFLSTNRDASGNLIDNKLAKICQNNSIFGENIFECIELEKCENPVSKFTNIDFGDKFNYKIVNTGIVKGVDKTTKKEVKYQCVVEVKSNGSHDAKYYKVN